MLIPEAIDQATTFYLSGLLPCPYLAGQMERKLFAKLSGDAVVDGKLNGMLTQAGFRPVSYTHLDVYKRQLLRLFAPGHAGFRQAL